MRGSEKVAGKEARDFVRELILGKRVLVKTEKLKKSGSDKKGKYGRYIATVFILSAAYYSGQNLNDLLVEKGLAKRVKY